MLSCRLPVDPEELAPVDTLMEPLVPTEEPVLSVAEPLEPAPETSDEKSLTLPEPAETPTPEEIVMAPPSPADEVLAPADS